MNVESQTPPGSTPPSPPPSSSPEQPWISPRLRAKLDDPEPDTPREGPPPWIGIALAVLVVAGGAGLFAAMRTGAAKQKADAERVARERVAAAAAESTANVARVDSMRAASHAAAESLAKAGGPPKPASTPGAPKVTASAPASSAPPAVPATPAEKGPFGIDVGSFLDEERAKSELEKLAATTGLKGKVVTRDEAFHVVLGSFSTRAAADKRAESLVGRALVNQAQSISLAP